MVRGNEEIEAELRQLLRLQTKECRQTLKIGKDNQVNFLVLLEKKNVASPANNVNLLIRPILNF